MRPSVILLIVDTLRLDYSNDLRRLENLGFIGYDNAIATAPWTVPSHASIFTGLMPSQHGLHATRGVKEKQLIELSKQRLGESKVRLLSYFKKIGYSTFGLSCNPYISPSFGYPFDNYKSFDHFGELGRKKGYNYYTKDSSLRNITRMIRDGQFGLMNEKAMRKILRTFDIYPTEKGSKYVLRAIQSLSQQNPFFLFINIMEAHEPYLWKKFDGREFLYSYLCDKPVPYHPPWMQRYGNFASVAINRAIKILGKLNAQFDNSLIIVTSDHGQLIGEGGRYGHSYFLDDELLRVPFYVRYPEGVQPFRKKGFFVSLAEIPQLVESVLENVTIELGSDKAIAESFGPWVDISSFAQTESERLILERAFTRRLKVYTKSGSAVYNESTDKIEDLKGDVSRTDLETALSKLPKEPSRSPIVEGTIFNSNEEEILRNRLRELGYD